MFCHMNTRDEKFVPRTCKYRKRFEGAIRNFKKLLCYSRGRSHGDSEMSNIKWNAAKVELQKGGILLFKEKKEIEL